MITMGPADVTFDMSYASTVLKTQDGREVHVSQGLCSGSCSTLQSLFKVDPDQRVYTLPSQVDSHSLSILMEWLHGARHSMRLGLTHDQALPVMQAADYLGMQCWSDNCAAQMQLPETSRPEHLWESWLDLASNFHSLDLLMAVLRSLPPNSPITAPRICQNLYDIKLMQAAFDFFDLVSTCGVCIPSLHHACCVSLLL